MNGIAPEAGADAVDLSLTPGRRLRWSPTWDCSEEAVLFDAASGDYWLLAPAAQAFVRRIELTGPARLDPAPQDALLSETATAEAPRTVAAALVRAGVLQACQNGRPVSLAPAADASVD